MKYVLASFTIGFIGLSVASAISNCSYELVIISAVAGGIYAGLLLREFLL